MRIEPAVVFQLAEAAGTYTLNASRWWRGKPVYAPIEKALERAAVHLGVTRPGPSGPTSEAR